MTDTANSTDLHDLIARRDNLRKTIKAYENTDTLGYEGIAKLGAFRRDLDDVSRQIEEAQA